MSSTESVILEHLAATRWFGRHGEIALTAGLTFCLGKDPAAAAAFVKLIRERTHTGEDIPSPVRWQGESIDDDRKRIDVAGWFDTGKVPAPVVFVEAKVSAVFAPPDQVSKYVESQKEGLERAGVACGAMAILVPEARVVAACHEVARDLALLGATGQDPWRVDGGPAVTVTVISWDEALHAMLAAAGPASCDLEQLHGACRALRGADVTALTAADLTGGWRSRRDDLRRIIDRVTRGAVAELSLKLYPQQPKPYGGLDAGFRDLGVGDLPHLCVGTRVDGESESQPLWVRFHQTTNGVSGARARLEGARDDLEEHEGHLLLPLVIEPDAGSATRQIESLVSQVVQLYKTAVNRTEPA